MKYFLGFRIQVLEIISYYVFILKFIVWMYCLNFNILVNLELTYMRITYL